MCLGKSYMCFVLSWNLLSWTDNTALSNHLPLVLGWVLQAKIPYFLSMKCKFFISSQQSSWRAVIQNTLLPTDCVRDRCNSNEQWLTVPREVRRCREKCLWFLMRCPLGYILFQLEQEWNMCHLWLRRNTSDSSGSFQSYYSFKENIFFFNIKLNKKSKYFQKNILRKIMSAFRVIRVKQQISKQTTLSIMLTLVYKDNIWDQNSVLVECLWHTLKFHLEPT